MVFVVNELAKSDKGDVRPDSVTAIQSVPLDPATLIVLLSRRVGKGRTGFPMADTLMFEKLPKVWPEAIAMPDPELAIVVKPLSVSDTPISMVAAAAG